MKLSSETFSTKPSYLEPQTENPLRRLGESLQEYGYYFTPISPATRDLVLSRPHSGFSASGVLRELFGWGREVPMEMVPGEILLSLNSADMLEVSRDGDKVKSRIRATTIGSDIFLHSTDPLVQSDGVYLSPDVHQYIDFLKQHVTGARHLVELNCGTGAGGLSLVDRVERVDLVDSSAVALEFSRVNTELAGAENVNVIPSYQLNDVEPGADLIIAHPQDRVLDCREYGNEAPLQVLSSAMEYLRAGGKLLLFTATCIVNGRDMLKEELETILDEASARERFHWEYVSFEGDVTELGAPRAEAPRFDFKRNVGLILTARHS